ASGGTGHFSKSARSAFGPCAPSGIAAAFLCGPTQRRRERRRLQQDDPALCQREKRLRLRRVLWIDRCPQSQCEWSALLVPLLLFQPVGKRQTQAALHDPDILAGKR